MGSYGHPGKTSTVFCFVRPARTHSDLERTWTWTDLERNCYLDARGTNPQCFVRPARTWTDLERTWNLDGPGTWTDLELTCYRPGMDLEPGRTMNGPVTWMPGEKFHYVLIGLFGPVCYTYIYIYI